MKVTTTLNYQEADCGVDMMLADDFILSLARRFVTDAGMELARALDEAIDDYKYAMSSVSFSVDISETDRKYLLAELTDIVDEWPR